jgi:hypothetical protein
MVDPGFDPHMVGEWLRNGKVALDLLNSARALLPKGVEREAIETKINEASDALERGNASLAKALGYHLCQCTFPPQVMLWRERQTAYVCQNPDCGRKIETGGSVLFTPGTYF